MSIVPRDIDRSLATEEPTLRRLVIAGARAWAGSIYLWADAWMIEKDFVVVIVGARFDMEHLSAAANKRVVEQVFVLGPSLDQIALLHHAALHGNCHACDRGILVEEAIA